MVFHYISSCGCDVVAGSSSSANPHVSLGTNNTAIYVATIAPHQEFPPNRAVTTERGHVVFSLTGGGWSAQQASVLMPERQRRKRRKKNCKCIRAQDMKYVSF